MRISLLAVIFFLVLSANAQSAKPAKRRARGGPVATGVARTAPKMRVAANLDAQLAKWKPYRMAAPTGLSASERQLLAKLVEAQQYVNDIYWRQSDPEGLALLKRLRNSPNARDQKIVRMLRINGSRYDLLEEHKPFVGDQPYAPGRGFYPEGLTREQVEQYVKDHPENKDAIYSPFTIVRRNGAELEAIPYRVAFRAQLGPAAKALREAAGYTRDPAFARFLRLRAEALLKDDYYESDISWME